MIKMSICGSCYKNLESRNNPREISGQTASVAISLDAKIASYVCSDRMYVCV